MDRLEEAVGVIEHAMKFVPDIDKENTREAIEGCLLAARLHLRMLKQVLQDAAIEDNK